jgi:hypothetical protein
LKHYARTDEMSDNEHELTDEQRADILTKAYDFIENLSDAEVEASTLDPHRADVIESMRPQQRPSDIK